MTRPHRFGSAVSAIVLASMIAGCAAPQQKTGFGGKTDADLGLATRALLALNAKDVPVAIDYAEQAVAKTPNDAGFRALLGNAYFTAGRFWSAEAAYKDSLRKIPDAKASSDPWGTVRSTDAPKAAAAPAKKSKTGSTNQ